MFQSQKPRYSALAYAQSHQPRTAKSFGIQHTDDFI